MTFEAQDIFVIDHSSKLTRLILRSLRAFNFGNPIQILQGDADALLLLAQVRPPAKVPIIIFFCGVGDADMLLTTIGKIRQNEFLFDVPIIIHDPLLNQFQKPNSDRRTYVVQSMQFAVLRELFDNLELSWILTKSKTNVKTINNHYG